VPAYYTRPMSPARDREIDATLLASERGGLERCFSQEELPRLVSAGAGPDTFLRLAVRFEPCGDRVAVRGTLSGEVGLRCQRCLDVMTVRLEEPVDLVIVESDGDAADISGERDAVVAESERLDVAWLAEEEALLALPLIVLHERLEQCATVTPRASRDAGGESNTESQRPFANLRDMLGKS
jgi:DUF177 domain-containing protein